MTYWLFNSLEVHAFDPVGVVHTQHTWSTDSPCRTSLKQQRNKTSTFHKRLICMDKSRYRICPTSTTSPVHKNNITATAASRPPRIAVAVIAARRADYFSRLLQSLENQQQLESIRADVHIFVDHCEGNQLVLDLAQQHAAASPQHTTITVTLHTNFTTNQGVARLTWAAMELAFGAGAVASGSYYDQLILLEEDHVIGPNYIATLSRLLTLSDRMDSIGVVSGNLLNYTHHSQRVRVVEQDSCQYQVLPLDGFTSLASHNIWAWGMSRFKYMRMRKVYENGLVTTGLLSTTPYDARDTQQIARWMRRTCGQRYRHWQGQDWVRACAMAAAGMPYKLQTVDRTLQYIGVTGLHSTNESFVAKQYSTEFPVATQRLEYAEEDMCERLCYSDIVVIGR